MTKSTLPGRAARGLVAGVIGTAAMTAWQELSAKLRGGEGEASQDAEPSDPWAEAPTPARAGRMILQSLGQDVPADKIGLLTNVMHWGYGTTWGGLYGAVMGSAAREQPLLRGLAFGAWVWVMSYIQLVPLGLYEPPWKYPPSELAFDLSYHLAYGAGLGAAAALVEP